ncbi:MAG: ABC transporter permease [Saprospiraceae bacterium]|nr:MAG: ABC transporter permease [Saprospiraceae bacterium]
MLQNYFKVAYRHFWKHKVHLLINVLGLGIALASCVIAYLSWKFDHDFDHFHTRGEQIFRVVSIKKDNLQAFGVCPAPLAAAAKAEVSGVQDALILEFRNAVISNGKDTDRERISFTENAFFEWFDFPLLSGQIRLDDAATAVISEALAIKYFGTSDPVGQILTIYPDQPFQKQLLITGLLKDTPVNSSIQYELLTSVENMYNRDNAQVNLKDWTYLTDATFLMLKNPEDQERVSRYLEAYLPVQNQMHSDWQIEKFALQPLNTMAHHADDLRWNALGQSLPPSMVWGMTLMGILLLLTASLNFTNMSISLSGRRLKEIGVRKVIGGSRKQLIWQLLMEGLLISLIALGVGLLFTDWLLPRYNQMWTFVDLHLVFTQNLPLVAFLIAVLLTTTFIAAAYPAFYISGFNPTGIFRGKVKFAGANLFSKILLGAQVGISTIALVAGFAFTRNAEFQKNADIGFQREGIQAIRIPDEQTFRVMEANARQHPQVQAVAGVRFHIGDSAPRIEVKFKDKKQEVEFMPVGENYLEVMDIQLLSGRSFDYQLSTDFTESILINEKFADLYFQDGDPLGQQLTLFDTLRYNVVGVVKNFIQDNFHDPIRPLVLTLTKPDRFGYLVIKTQSADMLEVRDHLSVAWKKDFAQMPFEHYFQDDFLASSLKTNTNIQYIFSVFALIALLLSMTGLNSLVSLNLLKRLKEVTIRRILGARPSQIAYLLSAHFLIVAFIGLAVGGLIGLKLSEMLLNSIYQVHVGVTYFSLLVAGIVVVIVAFLTISRSIVQAITANPSDALNND